MLEKILFEKVFRKCQKINFFLKIDPYTFREKNGTKLFLN